MNIRELNNRQNSFTNNKLVKIYSQFGELLHELIKRELPKNIEKSVNDCVDQINSSTLNETQLTKFIKQKQTSILKQIEKQLKIVTKNKIKKASENLRNIGKGSPPELGITNKLP